jgi:hypothetical protein
MIICSGDFLCDVRVRVRVPDNHMGFFIVPPQDSSVCAFLYLYGRDVHTSVG